MNDHQLATARRFNSLWNLIITRKTCTNWDYPKKIPHLPVKFIENSIQIGLEHSNFANWGKRLLGIDWWQSWIEAFKFEENELIKIKSFPLSITLVKIVFNSFNRDSESKFYIQ